MLHLFGVVMGKYTFSRYAKSFQCDVTFSLTFIILKCPLENDTISDALIYFRVINTIVLTLKPVLLYVTHTRNQFRTGKVFQATLMMHFNTQMAILTFSKMVDTGDSMTEVLV